ncbi:uncharacterized protein LOC123433821 [Hordeum vulgare subsp. vulgare]|uniref:uncharacterized protein LOC123433821 n=1 Tax=Hordeum vulgare subsp. vulgare TaxID=112509 RepID=UPI00162AFB58|nr:uncharacterized protein LOC123433821 [Hordeum vulgare subsp. vulgare]
MSQAGVCVAEELLCAYVPTDRRPPHPHRAHGDEILFPEEEGWIGSVVVVGGAGALPSCGAADAGCRVAFCWIPLSDCYVKATGKPLALDLAFFLEQLDVGIPAHLLFGGGSTAAARPRTNGACSSSSALNRLVQCHTLVGFGDCPVFDLFAARQNLVRIFKWIAKTTDIKG